MDTNDELASLRARIAELEKANAPAEPKPPATVGYGPPRDANGYVIPEPDLPSDEERSAAQRARMDAEVDAFWERATAGLPTGMWRDPCGIVRNQDGTPAHVPAEKPTEWIRVKLRERWFAPGGYHYPRGEQIIPATLRDRLPSTAVVIGPCEAPPEPVDEGAEINKQWSAEQRERGEWLRRAKAEGRF